MYQIVSINSGLLDIDYHDLIQAIDNKDGTYTCYLKDTATIRPSWKSATQDQFNQAVANLKSINDWNQEKTTEFQTAFAESFTTFQSSALGVLKTYPADAGAVQNMQYYVNLLAANPNKSTVYFKTIEDGKPVLHTRTQFFQVLDDFETFDVNRTTKFDNKIAQVNASPDIPTVQSLVWNDTTPPAAPTGLTATSTVAGQITANWTANSEIDVQIGGSYNLYLTDTTANTATTKTNVVTNSDTLTGLTSGHVYSVAVSAVDSDGNESQQCTPVTVTVM
ncbi:fibronectin type III domain-containing protein [Fodinisporobacter ferrooxydans]|uniref:Fibronectin type III domain-containing protein n=1 Tax=Fodinisporobacter ferrooxydans TaxID=2901836 RepID=A0ABY4CJS0_9BACL|nr:fibronectin type III domain-containing protein [Alicyclobacillaceae bacterium MYW30-H2]